MDRDGSNSEFGTFGQPVRPLKFFAFGLGNYLVEEKIGRFKVILNENSDSNNLEIIPCKQSE